MGQDSTDSPKAPGARITRRGSEPDLPPQDPAIADIDPATAPAEDDDETLLPEIPELAGEAIPEGPLAIGHAAIEQAVRLAPTSPGVYRMLNAANDVLYVGKAKNVRKRLASYARVAAVQPARIMRTIAATVTVEIVSTATETEALLLEANLIKQLRPRFNVQLRDDKSFPYILITGDHWAPQILKHRGAQTRPGRYFGPFASAGAVNRTITALQRAFLIRSCTDGFFESRTRPCLLYQIRRCSGPCTSEIDFPGYTELVREAKDFLSGRSHLVKQELAGEMEKASAELAFETAALYRDRLAALSAIQSQQGINPRTVQEADVFAIHQEGGYSCVEVFFFRTGQNWGNRAYFPRADKSFTSEEVLASFLAQFYDDKPPPKLILLSHQIEESELLADALSIKAGFKVEVSTPRRGEKKELVAHALTNAREALGRKLADTATQGRLLQGLVTAVQTIVLIGDPNQLPMVTQGVHPSGAAASALEHLVGRAETMPPERGLFLETSRRMHPDVNAFISPAFYVGLLETHPDTAHRVIDGDDPVLSGSGVRWLPVRHAGNGPRSREEAAAVATAVQTLLGMTHVDETGVHRALTVEDIIIVAPYNAQVAAIQAALEVTIGRRGNVGTVDKFQGREGVVAIYSMASSSREDAPRDMTFLYSRNRLNVAISRAQSLALLFASPELLRAGCRTPEQIRMVDALCRYVEIAEREATPV